MLLLISLTLSSSSQLPSHKTRWLFSWLFAIPWEQANDAFLFLTADTYRKLSDDLVRFLWTLASSVSTNSRLSQPSFQGSADPCRMTLLPRKWALHSRGYGFRLAAIAKASAAHFVPDSSLRKWPPSPCFCKVGTSQQPLNLPLLTIPRCPANRVRVLHVFLFVCACFVTTSVLVCFCSRMLFVHLYTFPCVSLVFSAHSFVRLCISLYTALFYALYLLVIAFAFLKSYSLHNSQNTKHAIPPEQGKHVCRLLPTNGQLPP
jgi:hypothetical protein